MESNKLYIFLIFSPTIEIVVSRIIEYLLDKKICTKESLLILFPSSYKPQLIFDIKSFCFDEVYSTNNKNKKSNKINSQSSLFLKIQYCLYSFRRLSNFFGKRFYLRLGKLPVSFLKITRYKNFINRLKLNNKEIILFTPNIKVHIFQILVFFTRSFKYQLIEEGIGAFKSINETELLFSFNLELILADIFALFIRFIILSSRTLLDVIRIIFSGRKFSFFL